MKQPDAVTPKRSTRQEEWRHVKHAFLSSGTLGRDRCDICASSFKLHKKTPYGGGTHEAA